MGCFGLWQMGVNFFLMDRVRFLTRADLSKISKMKIVLMKPTIEKPNVTLGLSREKSYVHFLNHVTCYFSLLLFALFSQTSFAQAGSQIDLQAKPAFSIGLKLGYDLPLFATPYKELKYKGNRYLGAQMDYRFPSNIGIRLDYANIVSNPDILIADKVYFGLIPSSSTKRDLKIQRHFIGLGPSYTWNMGNSRFAFLVAPMVGYSFISGGDAYAESLNPASNIMETQLLNTGFDAKAISAKFDMDFAFSISKNFSIGLGLYYLRHFGVHLDNVLDVSPNGTSTIGHGENIYDHSTNPYTVTTDPPFIVNLDSEKPTCMDLPSVGATIGLKYTFGSRPRTEKCIICSCPNDKHKVVVTIRDKPSQKVIPGADVAIKDMAGNIIATGTSNSFGVVDFGEIPHGNYTVAGQVYELPTTTGAILDAEFVPNAVIQKELLYDDLRFILKGVVVNKNTRTPEPNVVVSLSNDQSGSVVQDNSDGKGEFTFRLDQKSSYEVVGIKENRLSDIDRASTVGLTRSTTLFVDLELGVENFDCGKGTVLDIKYDLDKADLLPESKFDLDKLTRYMKDHQISKVELSSHTDSRGSNPYNLDLSARRAKSAVEYILSKGISRDRIIAQGYGETRLLNRCADGINCSEEEHRINRRTEAKLLCN